VQDKIKNTIYNYLDNHLLSTLLERPIDFRYHLSLFTITNHKDFLREWASTHNLLLHFDYYKKTTWIDKTGSSLLK